MGKGLFYTQPKQVNSLMTLSASLVKTYNIPPAHVLSHSDVDITRRDPGVYFPWDKMHKVGVGAWLSTEEQDAGYMQKHYNPKEPFPQSPTKEFFRTYMKKCGYGFKGNVGEILDTMRLFLRLFGPLFP